MVNPPADRVHVEGLGAKRDGQFVSPATIRQQLLVCLSALEQVGEDHRSIITAHKVPLSATRGQEGEVVLITPALIQSQTTEEENQEVFVFETGDKVLDFSVIEEQLSLMVDVVEVFSDAWLWTLALDVGSGASGGGAAGGQAAQSGQPSAADRCCPEDQHEGIKEETC